MGLRNWLRVATASAVALAVMLPVSVVQGPRIEAAEAAVRDSKVAGSQPAASRSDRVDGSARIPAKSRDEVLPKGWRSSNDMAVATSGDARGLHVLVAESRSGYAWRTAATLWEPGFASGRWIGNVCVTGSGKRAVVVYAPRGFVNEPNLMRRGAFVAVVNLETGAVDKLELQATLAYYNPGCGAGDAVALSQLGGPKLNATRLVTVNAATGEVSEPTVVKGQVTSPVPYEGGYAAAHGRRLVTISRGGEVRTLAQVDSAPFRVHPDGRGGVAFLDREGTRVRVKYANSGGVRTVARGKLGELRVTAGAGGRLFVTGRPAKVGDLARGLRRLDVPAEANVSSHGRLAVTKAVPPTLRDQVRQPLAAAPHAAQPVSIEAVVPATGKTVGFTVDPAARASKRAGQGRALSPALGSGTAGGGGGSTVADGSPTDPVEEERTCSVPRNDPNTQVYQPTPEQVEWAANLAVTGDLTITRPADWKQSGLPSYSPQGMFPAQQLDGGGHVPTQVLLGVLTQESNLSQASWHAVPGVTGNPLVGNYYGRGVYDEQEGNEWDVRWAHADCGYGVGQVTDGMERGSPLRTPTQQRAIAVDYAANIAAALRILVNKWNTVHAHEMTVNNDDPSKIENWFYATWAYNSGFHYPGEDNDGGDRKHWGVGWVNNPINPLYPADREPFLEETYADAANPENWPYPEKVIGWASYPIHKPDRSTEQEGDIVAGYEQAYWIPGGNPPGPRSQYSAAQNRHRATPPIDLFCTPQHNNCHPDNVDNPCWDADYTCWWHKSVTWKPNCWETCGFADRAYQAGDSEPADGGNYPPNCDTDELPANALVVDDVPDTVDPVTTGPRPCAPAWNNVGSFGLRFADNGEGDYTSKIDFHQIGAAFGSHFWFAHTRRDVSGERKFEVTGTWALGQELHQWARVFVHMPGHGAHTQQAKYLIDTGPGGFSEHRYTQQRRGRDKWVSIGVFDFSGTPRVRLSSVTQDGYGSEDIAWDAIAFQPLPDKPDHRVVAMGDSYTSGEGAGAYYHVSDNNYGNTHWNACRRSRNSWPRQTVLPRTPLPIGTLDDRHSEELAFTSVACSGALTENMLGAEHPTWADPADFWDWDGQFREIAQLESGYLTEHTTLVMLSIGGNDAGFADALRECASPGDCTDDGTFMSRYKQRIREAQDGIADVIRAVQERAPNAQIVLMGYPALFSGGTGCINRGFFDPVEAPAIDELALYMRDQMQSTADDLAGEGIAAAFADPIQEFAGHGICDEFAYINGIKIGPNGGGDSPKRDPDNPACNLLWIDGCISRESFHPNDEGATAYAQAMERALERIDY